MKLKRKASNSEETESKGSEKEEHSNLKGFEKHGLRFFKFAGNQAIGDCTFCNAAGKFYANTENELWDCKVCGAKGNFESFLTLTFDEYLKNITEADLIRLADNRGLPLDVFKESKVIGKISSLFF
jgi:hypothetical protein